MKISKLILEIGIGYLFVSFLNHQDKNKLENLVDKKLNELTPSISQLKNKINCIYSVDQEINFKPNELKSKIKLIEKEIKEVDANSIANDILEKIK